MRGRSVVVEVEPNPWCGDPPPETLDDLTQLRSRMPGDEQHICLSWARRLRPPAPPNQKFGIHAQPGATGHRNEQDVRHPSREPQQDGSQVHRRAPSRHA
ncbi:hypothetical protein Pdca_68870 (plasmid) [Pseudonocardia autotrophica]|nr:hypothetical protein Pdca_68870 [Pseudonocardia autotrophica]